MIDLTKPRYIQLDDGTAIRAVEVTVESSEVLANEYGGQVIHADAGEDGTHEVVGVRLPTLYGALEVRLGEIAVKSARGRLSSMDKQQFEQSFMSQYVPRRETYSDEAVIVNTNPDIQSEEDLQAVTQRNLYEERMKRMKDPNYGRSADQ